MTAGRRSNVQHALAAVAVGATLALGWVARHQIVAALAWIVDRDAVVSRIQAAGAWAPLTFALMEALQVVFALIPGHVLIVAGVYVFGWIPAALYSAAAIICASQVCFWIARRFGRRLAASLGGKGILDRWERASAGRGASFYVLAFLLPVFPSDAMCYVAGVSTISWRQFLLANVIGRSLSAAAGSTVVALGLEMPWPVAVTATLAVLGIYIVFFRLSRRAKTVGIQADP